MSSPTTKGKIVYVKGDSTAWGWSSSPVRASADEVLAFVWDYLSARAATRRNDIERTIDETHNRHNNLGYIRKRSPAIGIDDREMLQRVLWRATGRGFEFLTTPEDNAGKRPFLSGVVRAKYPSAMKITMVGNSEATIEYVVHPDAGGSLPSWLMNVLMAADLSYVTEIQEYFQGLRRLSEYDEKDGMAVGETFVIKTKEGGEKKKMKGQDKYSIRVANVVSKQVALKELTAIHHWFPSLLEGMLSNWLRDPEIIITKLNNLSKQEARTIGRSLALALCDRRVAESGVDLWVNDYPALVEFAKRQRWFGPMVLVIGQRKIEKAWWGLQWNVGLGAVLGIADVGTDVYAIINFAMKGNFGFARALIAMVSASMAIQLLIVSVNGKKRGVGHMSKEALLVLTGLKPAVEAYRFISGVKADVDDLLEPMFMITLTKVVEMVTESIPSALVQIYANLASSDEVRLASLGSILISIVTIAFVTTTICFDFDLDPGFRASSPDFYGYVPNNGGQRTVVFFSMMLFSTCHIGVRLMGIALLAVVGPMITAAVLGGDMGFFLLFKIARGDLRYWLNLDGALSWVVTFVFRSVLKLMVDFTVMVQLRRTYEQPSISQACSSYLTFLLFLLSSPLLSFSDPSEIGGLYWIVCLVLGQATSFIALHLYSKLDANASTKSSHDLRVMLFH